MQQIKDFNMIDTSQRRKLLTMLLSELDGMVYLNRVDRHWTMEFISEGCYGLTGYNPEDLLHNKKKSFAEVIHPDDREMVWREINLAVNNNQSFSLEYRIIRADNTERWVSERGQGVNESDGGVELIHGFIQDITDQYNREKYLAEAEQRYRSIFENAIEGIFQSSRNGNYLRVNTALAKIYGYSSPEVMIATLRDIDKQLYVVEGRRNEFIQLIQEQGVVTNFESQVFRADGSVIWISENVHEVRDAENQLLYYEGSVEDICDRKTYEQLISHQATHDSLTNLPNRALIMDRIGQAIERSKRNNTEAAVLFIDLDHFKNINDSLGHNAGDILINIIAERLKPCLRACDTASRLGGDEFVILLTDLDSHLEYVPRVIERLLSTIEEPCIIDGCEYLITCSIGVSLYPADGTTAEELLKNADTAMYKAKQIGRNTYQFFTAEMNQKMAKRLQLEQQLRIAINEQQFELFYQPKINIKTEKITSLEALIRWNMPGQNYPMSPVEFIPLAESTGLINPLGQWVLNEACRQLREWIDAGFSVVPVAINISAIQFQQPNLVAQIKQSLQTYELDAQLLVVEITESCLALDEEIFLRKLYELQCIGVDISIDDFGTGYSNMHSLKTIPLDTIKIDRSFIVGIEHDHRDRAIYCAVVAMAQNLDLRVIAEGVETKAQVDFLRSINCDEIQGFYFYRPLPVDEIEEVIPRLHHFDSCYGVLK
jgi:diguanylate cyclase (GGDEF)-like protein/PAS domain S-box-containing protein